MRSSFDIGVSDLLVHRQGTDERAASEKEGFGGLLMGYIDSLAGTLLHSWECSQFGNDSKTNWSLMDRNGWSPISRMSSSERESLSCSWAVFSAFPPVPKSELRHTHCVRNMAWPEMNWVFLPSPTPGPGTQGAGRAGTRDPALRTVIVTLPLHRACFLRWEYSFIQVDENDFLSASHSEVSKLS